MADKPEHIKSILPRTWAHKAQGGHNDDFDLKTAQKALEEATGYIPNGLTLLQIELIAEHFKIKVKDIEKVLGMR